MVDITRRRANDAGAGESFGARVRQQTIDLVYERSRRERRKVCERPGASARGCYATATPILVGPAIGLQENHPLLYRVARADAIHSLSVSAEDSHATVRHVQHVPVHARPARSVARRALRCHLRLEAKAANLDDVARLHKVIAEARSLEGVQARAFHRPVLNLPILRSLLESDHDVRIDGLEADDRPLYPDGLAEVEHADRVMRSSRVRIRHRGKDSPDDRFTHVSSYLYSRRFRISTAVEMSTMNGAEQLSLDSAAVTIEWGTTASQRVDRERRENKDRGGAPRSSAGRRDESAGLRRHGNDGRGDTRRLRRGNVDGAAARPALSRSHRGLRPERPAHQFGPDAEPRRARRSRPPRRRVPQIRTRGSAARDPCDVEGPDRRRGDADHAGLGAVQRLLPGPRRLRDDEARGSWGHYSCEGHARRDGGGGYARLSV